MQPADVKHATEPCALDRAFRFAHGAIAGSLRELHACLHGAPDWVLAHHRGHFHPWIEQIVGDAPLAERFRRLEAGDTPPAALRGILTGLLETRLRELEAGAQKAPARPSRQLVRRRVA